MIEFDGDNRARRFHRRGRREHRGPRIEQVEDALGRCHGGLQNVVLFAQILNGAEESQPILQERRHHSQRQSAGLHAETAIGENAGHGDHREEFDHRIKPTVCHHRRFVGIHVLAIHGVEFTRAALLAVEKLQHRDARDVLLQIRVDLGDRHADAAVALAHAAPENTRREYHERHGEHHDEREHGAQPQHDEDNECERQHVAHNRDQARCEEVVEHVHIGGYARHQPAHRVAIVKREVEPLQVLHQLLAQVEHGKLTGVLHDVGLGELRDEVACQHRQEDQGQCAPSPAIGSAGSQLSIGVAVPAGCKYLSTAILVSNGPSPCSSDCTARNASEAATNPP